MNEFFKYLQYVVCLFLLCVILLPQQALAVTLDWKGYFRADNNYLRNYQMDSAATGGSDAGVGGEYIRGQGSKSATYSTFFAKMKPSALINDNIIVHSEWNIGDPLYGFFGRGVPTVDRGNPTSSGRNGLPIEAARLWLDVHTDFGLVQVGRAPMHWGLGVIFHSGDDPFDRFQSTMDTIRFISKFGYLSVMPLYAKSNVGKSLAGSRDIAGTNTTVGSDDVTDYGVGLKFHNPEDELEAGVLFYKRNAGDQQDAYYYPHTAAAKTQTAGANGMNLRLIDLYAKKTWYRMTLMGEVPFLSGEIGDINNVGKRNQYKATGFAGEGRLDFDRWHHMIRFGMAPGQGPVTATTRGDRFSALYFNRNYKLGQVLFRQNLGGFGANNPDNPGGITTASNLTSPYDAAIVNAKYVMLATENKGEQWSWSVGFVYAKADEKAQNGKDFYVHRTRSYGGVAAVEDQSDDLGFEVDLGLGYNWDQNIRFGADVGLFFPGKYFAFDNSVTRSGKNDMVTGVTFSAMAKF